MKNKLLPKILALFLILSASGLKLIAQSHNNIACPSKFWSHIDCLYDFQMNGYYIDTLTSNIPHKQHFHPFVESSNWYGCWDITVDTTLAGYGCGYCGFTDSAIFSSLNLPSSSQIYKFFSINTGALTGMGHILFHYEDIEWYHDLHNRTLFIPDIPYCCSSNLPEDCQTCNCGVGYVDWEKSKFAVFPARGPYWNNNCLPPL